MRLYSVFDSVGKEFFDPFKSKNDETAKRAIEDGSPFDGYQLFYIGDFNESTGVLEPGELLPVKICDVPVKKYSLPHQEVTK